MSVFFDFFMHNIYMCILLIDFLLALIIVFRERKQTASTWAWLLVLIFLPVIGFILYLFLGRGISNIRLFDLKMQNKIGQIEEIRLQQEEFSLGNLPKQNTGKVDATSLIHLNTLQGDSIYAREASVKLFTDGQKKFDSLIRDIHQAKSHIHLETYIFRMDNLGTKIYQSLVGAQKRGVKVRILLDSWGSKGVKKKDFKELIDLGGRVVFFFPLFLPWINPRLNYRNHRKIVVIDGEIGYVGGFNIGDEYLGLTPSFGYWRDNHLRITGESVYSLQNRFIMDWNSQHIYEIKKPANYFPAIRYQGKQHMQVVTSGPNTEQEKIKIMYLKMIMLAKEEVLIQTPYYIPDGSIHEALKTQLLSGVKVRLMIPNKPDHMLVYWATYSFAAELARLGAEIFIYQKGFIHAKTMVVDRGIATVGSANIDNRSFQLDFEVNAILYDEELAEEIADCFEKDILNCELLTKEKYARRNRSIRLKESLSRLISPLL